jgi:hypothetical protein
MEAKTVRKPQTQVGGDAVHYRGGQGCSGEEIVRFGFGIDRSWQAKSLPVVLVRKRDSIG